ncbi:MAG: hypothetical protein AB8E87_12855 [Prochlorococcus sp.]
MSEQGQNLFAKAFGQGMMSLPAEDKRNLLTAIRELEAKAERYKRKVSFSANSGLDGPSDPTG